MVGFPIVVAAAMFWKMNKQDDDHGVFHLIEKPGEQRILFCFGKLVFAVSFQSSGGLLGGKTGFAGLHLPQYRFDAFQIMLHLHSFLIENMKSVNTLLCKDWQHT